jgi:iron(III) transport system ATP-binding protein
MVFQDYAIFPHLTVKKNVSFGLENRKVPKTEIEKMVAEILETVQITDYKDRLPERLSGGQRQRVALARAIVIEPWVLLMDEPLSNLDAKLRVDMRNAIRDIQKRVGITTVYVTHDQEEAMAVSDRIAVMNLGVIQQIGTPQKIYHRPANVFVATFIGRANILEREFRVMNGTYNIMLDNHYSIEMDNISASFKDDGRTSVILSIRPEEFIIAKDNEGIKGIIVSSMFLGLNTHYFVQLNNGEHVEIVQESSLDTILEPGTGVTLKVKKEKINVFDKKTEINMIKGVVDDVEG